MLVKQLTMLCVSPCCLNFPILVTRTKNYNKDCRHLAMSAFIQWQSEPKSCRVRSKTPDLVFLKVSSFQPEVWEVPCNLSCSTFSHCEHRMRHDDNSTQNKATMSFHLLNCHTVCCNPGEGLFYFSKVIPSRWQWHQKFIVGKFRRRVIQHFWYVIQAYQVHTCFITDHGTGSRSN